jgi:transcriptional regulator with XRE-family HTH domain
MNETVGERIRRLRKETGLSADAVGERIRMSGTYVLDVERNSHAPGFFMAIELSKLFGVSLDYLAGLTEHQNNPYVKR